LQPTVGIVSCSSNQYGRSYTGAYTHCNLRNEPTADNIEENQMSTARILLVPITLVLFVGCKQMAEDTTVQRQEQLADGGLSLRPRDMAKIGLLFLNGGKWQDQKLIPRKWVDESSRGHIPAIASATYGYQWWRADTLVQADRVETFFASGYGGQKINVPCHNNHDSVLS
jgi:CubicO group peptidase (beta-lactamase class C family)